jgi:hypothetical protein
VLAHAMVVGESLASCRIGARDPFAGGAGLDRRASAGTAPRLDLRPIVAGRAVRRQPSPGSGPDRKAGSAIRDQRVTFLAVVFVVSKVRIGVLVGHGWTSAAVLAVSRRRPGAGFGSTRGNGRTRAHGRDGRCAYSRVFEPTCGAGR